VAGLALGFDVTRLGSTTPTYRRLHSTSTTLDYGRLSLDYYRPRLHSTGVDYTRVQSSTVEVDYSRM
jgi:hypothetical protein